MMISHVDCVPFGKKYALSYINNLHMSWNSHASYEEHCFNVWCISLNKEVLLIKYFYVLWDSDSGWKRRCIVKSDSALISVHVHVCLRH